ncbi:hypothetical protein GDO86_008585 [Hymenochirus boettgeri]|uniref:Uncharacterized protein n=1 Tax=Hymenochirus boettgeri TaxID=247094 RepID=A0A8T2J2B2_9PIPI|nr:hypothetical protein GDO86_008585 [Hymenochirus boettgeri]
MSALARLFRAPNLMRVPARRGIASKPAKKPITTGETAIGLSTFVVCFLVPSGWILSNLESYKKRD